MNVESNIKLSLRKNTRFFCLLNTDIRFIHISNQVLKSHHSWRHCCCLSFNHHSPNRNNSYFIWHSFHEKQKTKTTKKTGLTLGRTRRMNSRRFEKIFTPSTLLACKWKQFYLLKYIFFLCYRCYHITITFTVLYSVLKCMHYILFCYYVLLIAM